MPLLNTGELVVASQPFLDLFGRGITARDVKEFGYSQSDDRTNAWVTVYQREEKGTPVGETTYRLYHR